MFDLPMNFSDANNLLRTKLLPPRPRPQLITRAALLARLDAAFACKLTICAAPAGFGKTTLVSQWLHQIANCKLEIGDYDMHNLQSPSSNLQAPGIAWLALDAGDNDPVRFWSYLLAACQVFHADFGRAALARLDLIEQRPFASPALEPVLTSLLNAATALSHHSILVLEDYHLITSAQVHNSLTFVLDRLPPLLHLILISRGDPPLPLGGLRARGELNELHADDLRFSLEETTDFVAQALPNPLAPELIARLEQRTEGWAAGLRLAMIALRGCAHDKIAALLDTFSGSQPMVVEYLVAEVLHTLPEEIQSFLLQTSILPRLNASLCDAVLGLTPDERPRTKDERHAEVSKSVSNTNQPLSSFVFRLSSNSYSQLILEELERLDLFLVQLDDERRWYRYHALFAEAMQHAACQRLGSVAIRSCYARASDWYAHHGMLADAVEAALAAQCWDRAAALMEPIVEALTITEAGAAQAARRWIEQLPPALLHQRPGLCLGYAFALLHTSGGPPAAIAPQLDELGRLAEQGWRRQGQLPKLGRALAARALFALWSRRLDQASVHAREALEWLPANDLIWRGISLGFVGKGAIDDGKLDTARQILQEARTLTQAGRSRYATRAHTILLGHVCAAQSELDHAAALYRDALADAIDGTDLSDQSGARLGLAQLAYEWNDLDTAVREAQFAVALGRQIANQWLQTHAALLLARIQQARGAPQQARQQLAALLAQVSPHAAPQIYREILANQARLQLAQGDWVAIRRWAASRTHDTTTLPVALQQLEDLLLVRLLIAQNEAAAALEQLNRLYSSALADGRLRATLEIQLLMAQAHAACDQPDQAEACLREALVQASAAGYCRLLLDEGPPLTELLSDMLPRLREPALRTAAQALLQTALREPSAPDVGALLSRQEQRVLGLLADGRSNPEIAEALVVSVNTVKTQLKQIYRKLRVASRQEACDMARHLRLL